MSKVLIVDDDAINRMILEGMLIKSGHEVLQAADGQQAVDTYISDHPDIVLMDIMMPVMNGYDATKKIKDIAGDRFIPIIVLTAMTEEGELVKCVDNGADDFLTKPFSHAVLKAKMFSLTRMQDLYKTVRQQRDVIEKNRKILEEEQRQAAKIYKRMTSRDDIDNLLLRYHMSPMSIFNGDMLLTGRSPDGTSYVFLTDATGHGLPAALGAFPVRDIFYTMIAKACSIEDVIVELNRKLVEILPTEFFLCGALLIISADKKTYKIWNGGLPDVIVYRPELKQIIETIKSLTLPLGIIDTDSFSPQFIEINVQEGDTFIMYSDGATEAQRPEDQEYFGEERFHQAITKSGQYQVIDTILKEINDFCGNSSQTDDVSLVEYTVSTD